MFVLLFNSSVYFGRQHMTTSFHTVTILVATHADSQGAEIDARFNVQFTRHKKTFGGEPGSFWLDISNWQCKPYKKSLMLISFSIFNDSIEKMRDGMKNRGNYTRRIIETYILKDDIYVTLRDLGDEVE